MKSFVAIFLGWAVMASGAAAQDFTIQQKPFSLSGYLREMPSVMVEHDYETADINNLIHNRINLRWDITSQIHLAAEGRNRLFHYPVFDEAPFLRDMISRDQGLMDLSWLWLSSGAWAGHSMIDRLYVNWQHKQWQVRVGRQRINWGVNMVSNPNDLFNTYSFFDFDYPERPGADAVRIQHYLGYASRLELAYSPAREARNSVGALLVAFNISDYDVQALAGYFHHRAALGMGWAGSIGGAGFKGEATWFYHLEMPEDGQGDDLVAAISADYMFSNGTFAVAELLFNGGYEPFNTNNFLLPGQSFRADNIMFSKYAITLNATHSFSPVLTAGMSLMALPDVETFFVSPNINYSIITNLDLEFVAQLFTASQSSLLNQAPSSFYVSLKYSY